jgi:hypothetical protein
MATPRPECRTNGPRGACALIASIPPDARDELILPLNSPDFTSRDRFPARKGAFHPENGRPISSGVLHERLGVATPPLGVAHERRGVRHAPFMEAGQTFGVLHPRRGVVHPPFGAAPHFPEGTPRRIHGRPRSRHGAPRLRQ